MTAFCNLKRKYSLCVGGRPTYHMHFIIRTTAVGHVASLCPYMVCVDRRIPTSIMLPVVVTANDDYITL